MKYKLCSILLTASLAFSLWPSPVRADAEESGAVVQSQPGEMYPEEKAPGEETPGETAETGENAGKETGLPEERGQEEQSGEETVSNSGDQGAFPEEIVVTGGADGDGAGAGDTDPSESEEIMVFGLSDLDMDENGTLRSADDGALDAMVRNTVNWLREDQPQILNDTFLSGVSSTNTDWTVFGLARLGIEDDYGAFLSAAAAYVAHRYAEDPEYGLDYHKATEWHRLALAVLAAGGDPTSVGGQNLIADGVYDCLIGEPWSQGINGAFWSLLALDSMGYEVPEDAAYDRDDLIRYILDGQVTGGGWTLYGNQADADMTAMAVYALAPYYAGNDEVRTAVDAGLAFLRNGISADGDLESDGDYNCESTAQAIVAFASMGIDPAAVTSPVSGKSLLDGLAKYYNTDTGGLRHTSEDPASNGMATDQAMYAIAAYRRCRQGLSVWDFRSPADTSSYRISAGSTVYTAETAADAVLRVNAGVTEIQIDSIPVGNYDAAEVRAGEKVFYTAGRKADGSIPVEGSISVQDGTVLQITVYRQSGTVENWTLTVQTDAAAAAQAVAGQIARLPDVSELTLEDCSAVEAARTAYEALSAEEKSQVANVSRLEELEARIRELEAADEEEREKTREELQKKIEAIRTPVGISDRSLVNQYLRELEELGEWPEKEELRKLLEEYLEDIAVRQSLVDGLDQDIWNQIDPLRLDQEDAETVKSLMARYAALRLEEQELLANAQSLLDAADVIQSLEDGVVPASVFRNLRSTGETFVYRGVQEDGAVYTLSWDGADLRASADVNAAVRLTSGADTVKETAIQVEFAQSGSLNGPVTLAVSCGAADGTYGLYWLNPDKLTIQSAGTASVVSGRLEMTVSTGGRYWLSDRVVSLNGNTASGIPEGISGGSGAGSAGSIGTDSAGGHGTGGTGGSGTGSTGTNRNGGTASAGGGQSRTSGTGASLGSGRKTLTTEQEGLMSGKELQQIQGTTGNLQTSGSAGGQLDYTFTINGEDVKQTEDFSCSIHTGDTCGHADEIRALAVNPLILCMEEMENFPGTMLLSLRTELDDGTTLLFRYDAESRQAEYVRKVTVKDGAAEFTLSEGGDYFLADRALAGSLDDAETAVEQEVIREESGEAAEISANAPEETVVFGTREKEELPAWAIPLAIGAGAAAAAVIAAAVILYRKRRGQRR